MTSFLSLYRHCFLVGLIAFVGLLTACESETDVAKVDFSRRISVDRPQPPTDGSTLKVAIAAMISPRETAVHYSRLLDYLGQKLDLPVQLVQRKTYGEINQLMADGGIDMAFICSGPYALGRGKYEFDPLAVPVIEGRPVYRSYLIVNRHSAIESIDDLRGKTFAFSDPDSNTGCLLPTYLVSLKGETPETYFGKTIYTYSHDNSILAVARSLVDGASVHEQVWEYLNQSNPGETAQTRVIFKSEPFGNPPLVASSAMPPDLKKQIRLLLLTMHEDALGREILRTLMIDRFIPLEERWYEPVREMAAGLVP